MADYDIAYKLLIKAEYHNDPNQFLHLNKSETGFTLGGVYQKWHKQAIDWDFISRIFEMCRRDIRLTSKLLYWDKQMQMQVYKAFEIKYWRKHHLIELKSQLVANKLLLAIVNVDRDAIKYAQKIIGVNQDGVIGHKETLPALNNISEAYFLKEFSVAMEQHYERVARNNPELAHNLQGWKNRNAIC